MLGGGWIRLVVLGSVRWRFRVEDTERIAGVIRLRRFTLHARVSSIGRRDDLERRVKASKDPKGGSVEGP